MMSGGGGPTLPGGGGPPMSMNGPPGGGGPGAAGPRPNVNPERVQKMLDENSSLIKTISEYQGMGRSQEAMSYQVIGGFLLERGREVAMKKPKALPRL